MRKLITAAAVACGLSLCLWTAPALAQHGGHSAGHGGGGHGGGHSGGGHYAGNYNHGNYGRGYYGGDHDRGYYRGGYGRGYNGGLGFALGYALGNAPYYGYRNYGYYPSYDSGLYLGGVYGRGSYPYYGSSYYNYPSVYGYDYPSTYGSYYSDTQPYYGYDYPAPAGQDVPSASIDTVRRADYAPAESVNKSTIHVLVPDPNAKVYFDDGLTAQTGTDRVFNTPSLDPERSYLYAVRATWTENGQEVSRSKDVRIRPGQPVTIDFRDPVAPNDR